MQEEQGRRPGQGHPFRQSYRRQAQRRNKQQYRFDENSEGNTYIPVDSGNENLHNKPNITPHRTTNERGYSQAPKISVKPRRQYSDHWDAAKKPAKRNLSYFVNTIEEQPSNTASTGIAGHFFEEQRRSNEPTASAPNGRSGYGLNNRHCAEETRADDELVIYPSSTTCP